MTRTPFLYHPPNTQRLAVAAAVTFHRQVSPLCTIVEPDCPKTVAVHDGVYHPGFPSSIARQPRGRQYRAVRLRKALGERFQTPTLLAPTLNYSNCCGDIEHGKSSQGCVICTVVCRNIAHLGKIDQIDHDLDHLVSHLPL